MLNIVFIVVFVAIILLVARRALISDSYSFQLTVYQNTVQTLNFYKIKANQFGGIIKIYRTNKRYFNSQGAVYLRISFNNSRYKRQIIRVRIVGTENWQNLNFFINEVCFLSVDYEPIKGDRPVTLEFEMYRISLFQGFWKNSPLI